MVFKEKYIKTKNGLNIFTESTGDSKNPAVILIMGAMNQGIFWYDSFCEELSKNNFFVIRYDHRDTGFSSVVDFTSHPYDLNNLTEDVISILDSYNISKAHIIGVSMGGYIGQLLAVNYKEKVKTLTLISTTADHRPYMDATTGNFNNKYDLPYPEKRFLDYIVKSKNNPPKNDEDFRKSQIEGWKIMFGNNLSENDFSEIVELIDLSNKRNKNKYSPFNHGLAVLNSKDRIEIVKKIKTPTFIFHGEDDPCLPIEHGTFLNSLISNSKLEIIKGMGHMFSPTESKIIVKEIIDNLSKTQL
jgi:pimeloyl-ACP methyl ester carboxylesterase